MRNRKTKQAKHKSIRRSLGCTWRALDRTGTDDRTQDRRQQTGKIDGVGGQSDTKTPSGDREGERREAKERGQHFFEAPDTNMIARAKLAICPPAPKEVCLLPGWSLGSHKASLQRSALSFENLRACNGVTQRSSRLHLSLLVPIHKQAGEVVCPLEPSLIRGPFPCSGSPCLIQID